MPVDLQQLDQLQSAKKFAEVHQMLTKAVEEDHEDSAEVYWRLARANFDTAQEIPSSDKAEREPYFTEGREYAEKALVKDENSGMAHKWMAILLSSEGDFLPKKQKIEDAFRVKKHADRAHELCPEDGTILHFLGRFAFSVSNISWIERKIASSFMANPPTSTFQEALEYFLKADEKRKFLSNQLWIAKTYLALKDKKNAKEWFAKVSNSEPSSTSDKNDIAEATAALKKL